MSINLDHYPELLEELGEENASALKSIWYEATKSFSPQGLEMYLTASRALKNLGRGNDPVLSFIQDAPAVAKELGEDSVEELVSITLAMASKTSGAVIALVLSSAPTAARRLPDADLFRGYLRLLDMLLSKAPRGLRPLLEHIDQLLNQLTLGGLRRWAIWGAEAHKTDFEAQIKYFSLHSPDSQKVLQSERKGTLFVDVQRRINMYLRALWGRDFFMRPTSGDYEHREGYRPFIEGYFIHLPDAYDDPGEGMTGVDTYRASAAHTASHIVYTQTPISAEQLSPFQMGIISVIEDARVEALAIREFPGLALLWKSFHRAEPSDKTTIGHFLERIARGLIDPDYSDDHPAVKKAREGFSKLSAEQLRDNQISWNIGMEVFHELSQLGINFNPRSDVPQILYRDDNRYFWEFQEFDFQRASESVHFEQQIRKNVSLMEFVNELDVETAGDDAQEIWVLGTELFPYEDEGKSYNEMEGKEPVSAPFHYNEWDYQIQLERPGWCTLLEKRPKKQPSDLIDQIIVDNKKIVSRMKFLIEAMQPQGVQRIRKLEDGDTIDIEQAVRAMIDIRMGLMPDPRINMRNVRKVRDISTMLLLDLSESTNETVIGTTESVLELSRKAAALLADALSKIGDPFAIHGFASNGRHDVEYFRFKDFDQPYNEEAKSKLAGMTGQLSTRMGTAIRHAGHYLKETGSVKKILLVLTDGEPADIDVRDPQYLRMDTKKAVEEISRDGVFTFCISLDPRADDYVSRIFGHNNYMVIDHVARLPERLPALYMGITR